MQRQSHLIQQKLKTSLITNLIITSIFIGITSSLFALTLKHITEPVQHFIKEYSSNNNLMRLFILILGLSIIYLCRKYFFHNKSNKGIPEVLFAARDINKIPFYKIPSHFINGFLTLISGGSTGIEVSTVVSTGSIGGYATNKSFRFRHYHKEFVGAGVAAGMTALFINPLAGLFFAYEIIVKKPTKAFFITNGISVTVASIINYAFHQKALFEAPILNLRIHAIPFLLIFSIIATLYGIYLTISVGYLKQLLTKIRGSYYRLLVSAFIVSICILIFPELFGDGYQSIQINIQEASSTVLTTTLILHLIGLLFLKPVAAAVTLAAGGDGGVFAPALFGGAYLGLLFAVICNTYFDAQVLPVNFMVFGIALVLSASMHAPLSSLFIVCGMFGNYTLLIPLLLLCLIVNFISKKWYPKSMYHLPIVH